MTGGMHASILDQGHVAVIERTARGRVGVAQEIEGGKMEVMIKILLIKRGQVTL